MLISVNTIKRNLINPLVDFLFPPVCISCQKLLNDHQRRVCEDCWNGIGRITKDYPLYKETRDKLFAVGTLSDLVSCYVFEAESGIQRIAHAMKYEGFESLGVELGRRLGTEMNELRVFADVLIPIPLHKRKLRERGYNQAELIARGVSEVTKIPLRADLVHRIRYTQTQTQLSLGDREKNMEDAFEVMPETSSGLKNKTCILVDDVITTGATINSCARELISAGASKVIAASVALAR